MLIFNELQSFYLTHNFFDQKNAFSASLTGFFIGLLLPISNV